MSVLEATAQECTNRTAVSQRTHRILCWTDGEGHTTYLFTDAATPRPMNSLSAAFTYCSVLIKSPLRFQRQVVAGGSEVLVVSKGKDFPETCTGGCGSVVGFTDDVQ